MGLNEDFKDFEPDNIETKARSKIVERLEQFRSRIKELAPQHSIRPQSIPPSELEGMEAQEVAQLAMKYGHKPELGFACACPICRSIRKMTKREV